MKSIFAVTLLAISIFSFACNKPNMANSNSNTETANSNSVQANTNASANTAQGGVSAPADKEQVQRRLVAVYNEFLIAYRKGDKAAMERLLADDFTTRTGSKVYDKTDWITQSQGNPDIETQEISSPELISYDGNTAVLHITVQNTWNNNTSPTSYMRSATFVKRNGKWQVKSGIFGT